jgi:hypothetical protein
VGGGAADGGAGAGAGAGVMTADGDSLAFFSGFFCSGAALSSPLRLTADAMIDAC